MADPGDVIAIALEGPTHPLQAEPGADHHVRGAAGDPGYPDEAAGAPQHLGRAQSVRLPGDRGTSRTR